MSAALLLAWRHGGLGEESATQFARVATAFPKRVRDMEVREKVEPCLRAAVWGHPVARALGFAEDPASASWLTFVGNPTGRGLAGIEGDQLLKRLLTARLRRGPTAFSDLSPPFVLVFRDGFTDEIEVIADRGGLQHVYLRKEHDGTVWLSSSSLALALSRPSTLDHTAVAKWLGATHFLGTETFFHEIRKLGCGERIVLAADGLTSTGSWSPKPRPLAGAPEDAFLEAFLESLEACAVADGLAAELTGGLDSRLVLEGLLRLRVPFFAWTLGNAGSIDLRTIERLRTRVPFDHLAVTVPPDFAECLPDLVLEKHALGDGEENSLVYAPLGFAFRALEGRRKVSLSGLPGELVRGFYYRVLRSRGPRVRGVPVDGLVQAVVKDSRGLLRALRRDVVPDPEAVVRSAVEEFLLESPIADPRGLLEDFYLRVREQRFTGRGTTTTGLFCRHGLPYFGNDVVDVALSLPYASKRDGLALRRALTRLSPELASVPRESGIPVRPGAWYRPDLALRRNLALGRKAVRKFGGGLGGVLVASPPEAVPWAKARNHPVVRDFVGDLLLTPTTRINELLDPTDVRAQAEGSLAGGSLHPLGQLLTLELTLRRLSS